MNLPRLLFRLLLGRRLPTTNGSLTVPGLQRPIQIHRDAWGIPYVEAENESDAWYGLGFCQGQDRAFQLEGLLRVVRGTLAELVGADALPVDRLARRIGFRRAAERQLAVLDPAIRVILDAFAAGVTAGTTRGLPRRSHEFLLLRATPTPWDAADVLGVLKLQSFVLAGNWDVELARLKILTADGKEALAALDPAYPAWHPVTAPPGALAGAAIDRLAEDLETFAATVAVGGGSNNWAVAGSRTATRRPLLANDPHLAPVLPPHWYLAHVRTPEWAVAGAAFVGGPAIAIGHNGFAAWGVTAGLLDNTDLFLEEIGPDGRSIRQGEAFVPCEVRVERIAVKGAAPVVEEVLETPRGPIIGPALEGEVGAISLRALWLDPLPAEGLLGVHHTRDWESFRRCFVRWPALPLNMVYADQAGTIGWQLVGQAPRRRAGWGTIPLPGWDPAVGWESEPVPFDEMPSLVDPECGFVATANTQPVAPGDGPFLGSDWIDGYRLARIVKVLLTRDDWDFPGMQALQLDEQSLPWEDLRETILGIAGDGMASEALDLLRTWDGRVGADSPAATLFEFFLVEMARRVAAAKAPNSVPWVLGQGFTPLVSGSLFSARRTGHLVRILQEQPAGWFAHPWSDEIADALAAVVLRLRDRFGADPAGWAWGRVRPLTLRHPFGDRKLFDRVFNLGPFPWGGDTNTVSQGGVSPFEPTKNPGAIASLRMIVDVGNWEACRFALPGGQSGNPLSPHYADQLSRWRRGEGIPIAWSEDAVKRAARDTLILTPDPSNPRKES